MTTAGDTLAARRRALNPVLRRELIERWRGRRAFAVMTIYLAILTGLLLVLAWAGHNWLEDQRNFGGMVGGAAGPVLGRFLFENLFALVLLLVLFIGPAYAAAQIAGERERRTLGLLQITLVTPRGIVLGKLGAAVAWLLLLVLVAAPMGAIAFFLGGVTVGDLVRGIAYLVIVAVAVAAMGVGLSSLTRRTVAAVIMTYSLVLVLVLGTLFGAVVEYAIGRFDRPEAGQRPVSLMFNPFVGLADASRASTYGFFGSGLPSILTPFAAALPNSEDGFGPQPMPAPMFDDMGMAVEPLGAPVFDGAQERDPVWLYSSSLYTGLGLLGLFVAARRVRPGHGPRRRRRAPATDERLVTAPLGYTDPATFPPPTPPPGAPPPPPDLPPPAPPGGS